MARGRAGESRQRVFRFVRERLVQGAPPSVREVQRALGFRAVQTAQGHLDALVQQGLLVREAGKARAYRLKEPVARGAAIPLLGRVQAGALTTALEEHDEYVVVEHLASRGELFALRVRGDSMKGAGILEGDIVIVRRQPSADSGDIVVALVEDEATVKRLRVGRRRVELLPDNPAFDPIVVEPDALTVLGKVIEVRRYLEVRPHEPVGFS